MKKFLLLGLVLYAQLAFAQDDLDARVEEFKSLYSKANELSVACDTNTDSAYNKCDEMNDPNMKAALGMGQQILTTLTTSSPEAACGGFAKFLTAMQGGLAGYQFYCGMAQDSCGDTCVDAKSSSSKCKKEGDRLEEDLAAAIAAATDAARKTALESHRNYVMKKVRSCEDFKEPISESTKKCNLLSNNLASATQGAMGAMQGLIQLQQCKKQAASQLQTFCQQYPSVSFCQTSNLASEDCSNSAVASSNLVCICRANPLDSRCGGADTASRTTAGTSSSGYSESAGAGMDGSSGSSSSGFPLGEPSDFGAGEDIPPSQSRDAANGALARGSAGGSGVGGGGGGGGGNGPKADSGARGGGGLNTKILGGFMGGGGGPANSGSRFGSSADDEERDPRKPASLKDSKYQQYMKGKEFDPKRYPGAVGPDGISGPNSLSNFKKVNIQYQKDIIAAKKPAI